MPTNKDFKRVVRARMQKTGESYTSARARLLERPATPATLKPAPTPVNFAKIAGMSDAAVKAKTGCTWDRWVWALDRVEAHTWPHREIASYIREKYKTPSWWTQMVTVGYERIKGLRARGQRRDGGFEASKSKVFTVPRARLYRAFHDSRTRARWLPGVPITIRTATREKSMRITWPDQTLVELQFSAKGSAKSQVQIQHSRLPDKTSASNMKEYWAGRLGALQEVLTSTTRKVRA